MTELVFVYGSLKRGFDNHGQMRGARYLGEARVTEHRLVCYEESYPALCGAPGTQQSVRGELFDVAAEHLLELDIFEDVPTLYQRALVLLDDGRQAWAYVIPKERALDFPPTGEWWSGRRSPG